MIKRIPSMLNIFTMKTERCYFYLPIPYIRPSNIINNYYCYCSMASEKWRPYIHTSAKFQNTRKHLTTQVWWTTAGFVVTFLSPIIQAFISLLHVVCRKWDSVTTKQVPLDKNVKLKFLQINVLKWWHT